MAFRHFPIVDGMPGEIRLMGGLNLDDSLLVAGNDQATLLQNFLYRKNTPIQRLPFSRYSTVSYASSGPFLSFHEYIDQDGNSRPLVNLNDGTIAERTAAGTNSSRVSSLTTGAAGRFASVLGRVVYGNGSDTPRVGNGTTWRVFGAPAKVTTLAGNASTAGAFTGTRRFIVVPVIEKNAADSDADAVAYVNADWSNIVDVVAAANGQFDLTWTDIVDTRVNKYWVYCSKIGIVNTLFRVARIATGVQAATVTTTDANLSEILPPILGDWGTAPKGLYTAFAGGRLAIGNLTVNADEENAIYCSQVVTSTYDAEGFPTTRHKVFAPGRGPITGIAAIGETGEAASRKSHLFVGQSTSCYLLPENDPTIPFMEISSEVGLVNDKAWAQWGSYIFWIDKRKGLVFWRVGQDSPWVIGQKIQAVFKGGGNNSLTANQGDSNITLSVWNDNLLITVRDDSTKTGGNKLYGMDLLAFTPMDRGNAEATARFWGPWTGPGFAICHSLSTNDLMVFDNQNNLWLYLDSSATQDYIAGTLTNIAPKIRTSGLLKEDKRFVKRITFLNLFAFSNANATVRFLWDYESTIVQQTIEAQTYSFEWDDISWTDIDWTYSAWRAEAPVEWGCQGRFVQIEISWNDQEVNRAFTGVSFMYDKIELIRTYR